MQPSELRVSADGRMLRIVWGNGGVSEVAVRKLWDNCRSASSLRKIIDGRREEAAQSLVISDVRLVGSYGVNIAFADGDDRGIYPWGLLADMANKGEPE